MRIFPRKKRFRFRKFEAPEPRPQLPLETLIDEGLLIVSTGIRMAVKNQAILWVLRDGEDFDVDMYLQSTRDLVLAASAEATADANRIEAMPEIEDWEDESVARARAIDPDRRERRQNMLRGMSERLDALADDEAYLAGLALEARDAAWEEIGAAVTANALKSFPESPHVKGEDYDRAVALVRFDLEDLERERLSY